LCVYFFGKKIILFGLKFCNFFCNVNVFSILNILQNGNLIKKNLICKLKKVVKLGRHIPVRVVSRTWAGLVLNAASQLLPGIHDNSYQN